MNRIGSDSKGMSPRALRQAQDVLAKGLLFTLSEKADSSSSE
jgi:hypothetical protein